MALISDTGPLAHVPLWILESSVHHGAVRLYALLSAKWCDRDGTANPSRSELARSLNCSVDSIDRWAKQLVSVGALAVQHQKIQAHQFIENIFLLKLFDQGGGRTYAARVAAPVRLPMNDKQLPDKQLQTTDNLSLSGVSSSSLVQISTKKYAARFESFWSRYPRHERKKAASDIWQKKLKIEHDTQLYQAVMDGLTSYLKVWHDEGTEDRYIMHAVRFLKERLWEDEPKVNHRPKLTTSTRTMLDASHRFLERHRKEG